MVGTAFGTALLVEFALSADDALLFRSVGPSIIGAMENCRSNILLSLNFLTSARPSGFEPTNDPSNKARAFSFLFN
jgi:hypothetical protein